METTIEKTSAKKLLMYVDTKSKDKAIQTLKMKGNYLNEFLNVIETNLKRLLTDAEKLDVYNDGLKALEKSLKHHFQFPDATDEFNFQSMGIDWNPIFDYYHEFGGIWNDVVQSLENGKFVLSESYLKKFSTRFDYYTENPAQKNKFLDMTDLTELLNNELKGKGVTRGNALAINNALVFVGWSDSRQKYIPNVAEIRSL